MERARRPRFRGSQEETEHARPSSQGSSFNHHGSGSQYNAPHGTQNISTGNGPQFPGSIFRGPIYFGVQEHFDLLRECLRSLAFLEMNSRSLDIDAAAEGTCGWLLRHQTFKSWASCDRSLLWIKGKPGSGKSTSLRYVLDHAMEIPDTGEEALILSFFFHGRGTELQKTPLGLFRSLLYQLLRQVPEALPDLVDTFQQRCETVGKPGEKWQWHLRELQRFLKSSFLKVLETRPLWLFVDALDECGEENAVELAEWFNSLLKRPPSSGLKQSHICFSCRHYPILYLDRVFEICVEEENREDVSIFMQEKLSSFHIRTSSTILELVAKCADGVFLWAKLANVNSKDEYGESPLSWAAQQGHEAVVRLLLDSGADAESKGNVGQTPLYNAAHQGHEAIVRVLLDSGADVNPKDTAFGMTPLLWAADQGHEGVVKLLLDNGADVDSKDKDGRTPLSLAAEGGHEAVVQLLLDHGAYSEAADEEGQTPLSYATEKGHEAVVRLLRHYGADVGLLAAEGGHDVTGH